MDLGPPSEDDESQPLIGLLAMKVEVADLHGIEDTLLPAATTLNIFSFFLSL